MMFIVHAYRPQLSVVLVIRKGILRRKLVLLICALIHIKTKCLFNNMSEEIAQDEIVKSIKFKSDEKKFLKND